MSSTVRSDMGRDHGSKFRVAARAERQSVFSLSRKISRILWTFGLMITRQ